MTKIILESQNNSDLLLIKKLAERLKIKYKIQSVPGEENKEDIKRYYEIIKKGADVSNFGDPSEWQRKIREDRNISFT